MSEIQIQHTELDDSDRDENDNRKLPGSIEVIEEDMVNRVVSMKKPTLAALGNQLVAGKRNSAAPILSVRSHMSSARSQRGGRRASVMGRRSSRGSSRRSSVSVLSMIEAPPYVFRDNIDVEDFLRLAATNPVKFQINLS